MAEARSRLLLRLTFSGLLLTGLVLGTRVPAGVEPEQGLVRLAWRTMGEVVEVCRDVPEEERLRMPPHMRRERTCDQTTLPYELRVELHGELALERLVRPAGLFADRPLAVLENLPTQPGPSHLLVTYEPAPGALPGDLPPAEIEAAVAAAPRYALSQVVEIQAGRILLVRLKGGRLIVPDPGG